MKTILYAWMEKQIATVVPRDVTLENYLDVKPRKIIVLTGFIRVGKNIKSNGLNVLVLVTTFSRWKNDKKSNEAKLIK